MPDRVLFLFRLELSEAVLQFRQSDVVKGEAVSWASTKLSTLPKDDLAVELRKSIQAQLDQFCRDYARAREGEKAIESRVPAVPADFFSGSE